MPLNASTAPPRSPYHHNPPRPPAHSPSTPRRAHAHHPATPPSDHDVTHKSQWLRHLPSAHPSSMPPQSPRASPIPCPIATIAVAVPPTAPSHRPSSDHPTTEGSSLTLSFRCPPPCTRSSTAGSLPCGRVRPSEIYRASRDLSRAGPWWGLPPSLPFAWELRTRPPQPAHCNP